jgi:hypothetical protein
MMKASDFNDVSIATKAKATSYFLYQVAYQDQKRIPAEFSASLDKLLGHAINNHYCIALIDCLFDFNFDSLLSHFEWCCKFLFFNFSDTTIQLDILRKLKGRGLNESEVSILTGILENNQQPYSYSLAQYDGEAKFALMKRFNMNREELFEEIYKRDQGFRHTLLECLHSLLRETSNEVAKSAAERRISLVAKKYEPSLYGYIKITDTLTGAKQKEIITFLYHTLNDLFTKDYSLEDFSRIFRGDNETVIELNIAQANTIYLGAQKLHLLFSRLKDEKIIIASWEVIKQKIRVYNQAGDLVNSVYQISKAKISADKLRQVNKLLKPILELNLN